MIFTKQLNKSNRTSSVMRIFGRKRSKKIKTKVKAKKNHWRKNKKRI
jgi:hypothetical protein